MRALLIVMSLAMSASAQTVHDRAFWVGIVQHKFEVPTGGDPYALLIEMNALLGSTDPVLRDDVAYGAALHWIVRQRLLTTDQQRALLKLWTDNLTAGLGEQGTDSVFRRSFSALNLSLLAALDNEASFLSAAEHDAFVARMIDYLAQERDTRGYDAAKGWMHTPAHTADVLKFLARSAKLAPTRQAAILRAVADKCASVGHVFVWGEDERLAQVVRSIVRRQDFDTAPLNAWLSAASAAHQQLWAAAPAIDPAAFGQLENTKRVLRAVFVALSADGDLSPPAHEAREKLLQTLGKI